MSSQKKKPKERLRPQTQDNDKAESLRYELSAFSVNLDKCCCKPLQSFPQ